MLTDRKHFGFYSKRAGGIPAHGEKLVSYLGLNDVAFFKHGNGHQMQGFCAVFHKKFRLFTRQKKPRSLLAMDFCLFS